MKKKPTKMKKIKKVAITNQQLVKPFDISKFPLQHYSYSTFVKFSTNPYMFKVNAINGDYLETTTSPGNVIGRTAHKVLETYYKNGGDLLDAQQAGENYLETISDGTIEYTDSIDNREAINKKFAFIWTKFFQEVNFEATEILLVEKSLKHIIKIGENELPIPLKGIPDLVYRDEEGRLIIRDHKFVSKYSAEEEIDGSKLLQAVFLYFLVEKELGEKPYSIIFEEFKIVENRDKSRQLKEFEIIYEDHPLAFDFFYRFYDDVTNALLGKQVYVPNLQTFFDKEVSILAYIHRLDIDAEREKAFKKLKVDNLTDFLKKKIQSDGRMKKYLETVSTKFISAQTLNYKDMTNEDKIKMKLAEHGIAVEFNSKIVGSAVTMYCYEPSIGTKMTRIESFVKDIEQVIGKSGIRVLAPIPNSTFIGFEVPNDDRTSPIAPAINGTFNLNIGEDLFGNIKTFDIRTAPHMLVAGSTGSGKSVFLHSLIRQLMAVPNVELHLFDPKMVEFTEYEGQVEEYQDNRIEIGISLSAMVATMNERYEVMKSMKIKNISETNKFNYKFIVIDEFADLQNESVNEAVKLLAQKGRASGIHLIIATQRASTQIISGDIKINFPVKAIFKMAKEIDSRVMLDEGGAEKLLGKGDMLLSTDSGIERLQGYIG